MAQQHAVATMLAARLLGISGRTVCLSAVWLSNDPLAVKLRFVLAGREWVTVVARDLLRGALSGVCGYWCGRVLAMPMVTAEGIAVAFVDGDKVVTLVVDAAELEAFLDRTCESVPPGDEEAVIDDALAPICGTGRDEFWVRSPAP